MPRIEGLRNWGIGEFGNLGIEEFLRRKVEIVMVWQIQSLNSSILNC